MRVIRTTCSPPAPPEAWLSSARGATRVTETEATAYQQALLDAAVEEIEGHCRRFFAAGPAADGAPSPRSATTVLEVERHDTGADIPLIVDRPVESGTLTAIMLSIDRGPWEPVEVQVAPWGTWRAEQPGWYTVSASVPVDASATPADVVEAIARVWGYRYARPMGSGGADVALTPTPDENAIRRSGAGGLLRRHREIWQRAPDVDRYRNYGVHD